jgi:HAE1 family hydrophobic/amphiphilic exporter-1
MVFVEGLAGQVFSDLGLTVVTSLIAALIVAVLFIPMLASRTGFKLQTGAGMVSHALGSLEGRISLAALWRGILLPMGALLILMMGTVLSYKLNLIENSDDLLIEVENIYNTSKGIVFTVWAAVCAWPFLIALTKRMHDHNFSLFSTRNLPSYLKFIGFLPNILRGPSIMLVIFIPLFAAIFLPGNSGENRFGRCHPEDQRLAKLWGAFRAFDESRKRSGQTFLFTAPYFALRLAISFLLEVIGLSLVWSIRTIAFILLGIYRAILRVGRWLGMLLSRLIPSKGDETEMDINRGFYPRLIRWALASPGIMLALIVGCFGLTWWVGKQLETELLPEVHQSEFTFEVSLPVGTPLDQTVSILDDIEKTILKNKEIQSKMDAIKEAAADLPDANSKEGKQAHEQLEKLLAEFSTVTQQMELEMPSHEEAVQSLTSGDTDHFFKQKFTDQDWERIVDLEKIDTLLVMYGFDTTNMKRSDEGEHSARFKVLLKPSSNPKDVEEVVISRLRAMFEEVPDVTTRVTRPVLFSSKKPVVIQINGEDLPELKKYSDEATALLSKEPALADVEPTLRSGAPEVQITYDRQQIIRHGLNLSTVANQVRDMVKGAEATRFNRRDRRVPIVVRLAESDREQVADVGKLTINPGGDTPIPLNSIAKLTVGEGPSEIRRIDGKRVALVQANIGAGSLGTAVEVAKRTLGQGIDWPGYMGFFITGQNEEWERSRTSLYLALGLSLFLVYVIMASQFESLVQPFIIMFTIPMAFVGTVLGLKWLGINLSVVVFLGMIMLAGIVVNNAIVLVDYANTLRGRGLALKEAIVQAGCIRLRPILMTTATTVLGLLPMALGLGDGAEIRTPMAIAVICGLLTSTFLTLMVIPTIYYLFGLAGERLFQAKPE